MSQVSDRERQEPSGAARAFAAFAVYNYRLYWSGQFVSQTGTWMQRIAQAVLVLNLTHSPLSLGSITTVQYLPITVFSLFGGVIADRIPKRRLLIWTQSFELAQAVLLALLTAFGLVRVWHIYVLALMLGLGDAFDGPARQSFPVELVGRDDLPNAVALNSTLMTTSRIVGPSLGGIAITLVGVAGCFWLNAASFLAAIGSLALMRAAQFHSVPPRPRQSTLKLLRGGIAYSLRTPAVAALLLMLLFLGLFSYNFITVIPLLARYTLHTSNLGYGFLFAGSGFGSLITALFLAYARTRSQKAVLITGASLVASLAVLGLSHTYVLSFLVLCVTGVTSTCYSAITQTRLQLLTPDELRGRVMSLYNLEFMGSTPFGALFIGAISERWDPNVAVLAAAGGASVGVVLTALYLRGRSHGEMLRGTTLDPQRVAG